MTWQRYSKKEALNRIVRSLIGTAIPSDQPGTLSGDIQSEDEAIGTIAEILEDSLPGETPTIPPGFLSPLQTSVSGFIEHGHMWVSTGTVSQALSTSWLKPTGIFTNNGLSSTNITPTYGSDLIDIDLPGTYFVSINASVEGDGAYVLKGAAYIDGTRQDGIMFEEYMGASGSSRAVAAYGTVSVTGSNSELELYLLASGGTPSIKVNTASLMVMGLPAN
jgi:hypothetical protein